MHRQTITRRRALAWPLAACALPAYAQDTFPSRPVKLVVAFAPGTGSDALARIVGTAMSPLLGQPVVVDNRAGAGGILGTEQVARSPADGYTLALATTSTLLTAPALNPKARYAAEKDFAPVAGLARTAFVVVTANLPDAPQSLAQLMARMREGNLSFGSAGLGTVTHLATEWLLRRAQLKATHVPYRGSAQALTDVAGGQLAFGCDTLVAALPMIRGGRLRALAVTSAQRSAALPNVPTVAEAGLAGFRVNAWWGIVAPAGTPPDVVHRLADAVQRAQASPEVRQQMASQELEPMPLDAAGFARLIQSEAQPWRDFVRQTGLQVES